MSNFAIGSGFRVKAAGKVNVAATGTPIIDGYQTVDGDFVLLTAQTTGAQNGVRRVKGSGAWTDYGVPLGASYGFRVEVTGGTSNAGTYEMHTDDAITWGTDTTAWAQLTTGAGSLEGAPQGPLFGANTTSLVKTTLLQASGVGDAIVLPDGTYPGQPKRIVGVAGYDGTKTSAIAPTHGTAVTLRSIGDFVQYEWTGATWRVVGLQLAQVSYQGAGNNGAAAVAAVGAKIGDQVVQVLGFNTSTGIWVGLDTTHFERTVTVADQIQQTSGNLNGNTYVFTVQPRS